MSQLFTTFFTDFIGGNLGPISALLFILSVLYASYLVTARWVRFSWKTIYGVCAGYVLLAVFLNKWSETTFSFYAGRTLFLLMSLFAPFFFASVSLPLWRKTVIYLWALILMSFPINFVYILESLIHPNHPKMLFSFDSVLVQGILTITICLILTSIMRRCDRRVFSPLHTPENMWTSWLSVPVLFLALNIAITPASYESLRYFHLYRLDLLFIICLFMLYVYLTGIFYSFLLEYIHLKEFESRQHLMDIQNLQYKNLQLQMDRDQRERHDFKHSLRLLYSLSRGEKWDELKRYILDLAGEQEDYIIKNYSKIPAVNAVLNYYAATAEQEHIETLLQIDLPEDLPIPDYEICSLIGNIMENAIEGCMTIPEDERHFSISITVQNDIFLYIVSTNTFDGTLKGAPEGELAGQAITEISSKKDDHEGIGLKSIAETVDKYKGTLRLRHEDREFFLDIAMKIS